MSREFKEGTVEQGVRERIAYSFLSTPWGTAPSGVSAIVTDSDGGDVTSTVMPGTPAAPVGDLITLQQLKSLTLGKRYRVDVVFTVGGNVENAYFFVEATE